MTSSLKIGLSTFWGHLHGDGLQRDNGTAGGFTRARAKIDPELFRWIGQEIADSLRAEVGFRTWHDRHIYGIDGSTIRLPDSADIRDAFEVENDAPPLARVSQCVDLYSKMAVDTQIDSLTVGERELALDHFDRLPAESVVVMDRGYPAYWLFSAIESRDLKFLIRADQGGFAAVEDFLTSDEADRVTVLRPNAAAHARGVEYGEVIDAVKVRLIKIPLSSGETEVLITNLLDESLTCDDFSELYHLRWGSETAFRYQKCWGALEHFTGRTAHSVKQDFYAHVALWNLVAGVADHLDGLVDTPTTKHPYTINRVTLIAATKNVVSRIIFGTKQLRYSLFERIAALAQKSVNAVRPNRSFPRKMRHRHPFNPVVLTVS